MIETYYHKTQLPILILIVFAILVSIKFWSFIYLPPVGLMHLGITVVCLFLVVSGQNRVKADKLDFIVKWTIITIFLSIIPAVIDWGQSIYGTSRACISLSYPLFLYFVMRKYKVSPKLILKLVTIICIIWVFLELFQQLTYPPTVFFSGALVAKDNIIERMGLWRFYIWGVDFVMIAFSYWLCQIRGKDNSISYKKIAIALIFIIGLLCYCSRKHIYITLLIIMIFAFKGKGKQKYKLIIIALAFFYILFTLFYADLRELNEASADAQGEGEDFIRLLSAQHFLFDFSDSKLYYFFGAGLEERGSRLWKELDYLGNMFGEFSGYYQADIGILGYYSKFGLFGVSAILMYIVYFIRNWRYIDEWLKYFFIMKVILIIFDFWAIWDVGMMAYSIFLYLLCCNVNKNKQKELLFYGNRNTNISLCT